MYVPKLFAAEEDDAWRIASENPFALLMIPPEPLISPLPFVVDRENHALYAHVARANPIARAVDGAEVSVYFGGPHGYITPRWYTHPAEEVPTWNYVAALATGKARILSEAELRWLLNELSETFEPADGWRPSLLDPSFVASLLTAITGFAIEAPMMRAKRKLSQNRSEADRRGVMVGLSERDAPGDAAVLEEMRSIFDRSR